MPQFETMINLWNSQYDRASSTYNANTGEAPTANTPYSQTALLNQVANSPFEFRREEYGIWLNEILNDWVLPFLKKRMLKPHYLLAEFDDRELAIIDESIAEYEAKQVMKNKLLTEGKGLSLEEYVQTKQAVLQAYSTLGKKRGIDIPKGYLDVEGKITANITGELKNKQAILASLDNILKTIVSTFNPNTGEYSALKDPVLSQIFGTIVEMAGVPISFSQMKSPTVSTPAGQDLSAIAPITPVPNTTPNAQPTGAVA
jgi:hypothetical protein